VSAGVLLQQIFCSEIASFSHDFWQPRLIHYIDNHIERDLVIAEHKISCACTCCSNENVLSAVQATRYRCGAIAVCKETATE